MVLEVTGYFGVFVKCHVFMLQLNYFGNKIMLYLGAHASPLSHLEGQVIYTRHCLRLWAPVYDARACF